MKSFKLTSVATLALLLSSATVASAQKGGFEIAAGGGYAHYHDTETASGSGISLAESGSSSKGKFVASASYNLLNNLSIGFEYSYSKLGGSSTSGGFAGTSVTSYNDSETDKLNNYGGVLRYGFGQHRIQPYVLVAGGAAKVTDSETVTESGSGVSISQSQSTSDTGGYFGAGGGVNLRFGHFGVRPEVRYQRLSFSDSFEGVSLKDKVNEVDVTGTLFYTFGGTHPHHHHRR